MKVEFYKHPLGQAEIDSITKVLRSTFLTSGPKTKEFEQRFAEYCGARWCTGVTSWTMGGFIGLKALGVGPGDEVITTPMTFVATASIIIEAGATPIFVDVEASTGNIDAAKVEAAITPRTKGILPVHLYGQMCDMRVLREIADRHGLFILEDCAHAVESERNGVRPGALSEMAVFSFYATKNLSSGEGGAIITKHDDLYEKLLKLRLHGMDKSAADRYVGRFAHYDVTEIGYKCNMFDLQAALLIPQLPKLDERLARREEISQLYTRELSKIAGLSFPSVLPASRHARHLYTFWTRPDVRDNFLSALQDAGVGVAVNFRSINRLTYYRETMKLPNGSFANAEWIGDSTITLPLYVGLTDAEVDYVIAQVGGIASDLL